MDLKKPQPAAFHPGQASPIGGLLKLGAWMRSTLLAPPAPGKQGGAPGGVPAVFIDKDGTFVEDVPHNTDPEKLRFVPGAPEALAALSKAGFALVVVTNQSGIEQGYFSRAQFAALQSRLEKNLLAHSGVVLTDFLLCPHAPGPRDMPKCLCHKPAPGMLVRAARRHRIDLARSWMVGDTLDDVEAGRRAGCRAILLDSGSETRWRRSPLRTPHHVFRNWREVTREVLQGGIQPQAPDQPAGEAPAAAHRLAAAACP